MDPTFATGWLPFHAIFQNLIFQLRKLTVRREIYDALDWADQSWQRILAARQNVLLAGLKLINLAFATGTLLGHSRVDFGGNKGGS